MTVKELREATSQYPLEAQVILVLEDEFRGMEYVADLGGWVGDHLELVLKGRVRLWEKVQEGP